MEQIKEEIIEAIEKAQSQDAEMISIYNNEIKKEKKNNFVFFIKPEITKPSDSIDLAAILDLIFKKLDNFDVITTDVRLLSASYMDKHNIAARHYGVINAIARNAKGAMSQEAKDKFAALFGPIDENNVMGGIEFQHAYPEWTAEKLDALWEKSDTVKLAGGTYCAKIDKDGKIIYLINGFHPMQLNHFIEKGRSIIVFNASSNLNWEELRGNLIGATNPKKAADSSIRAALFKAQNDLGLDNISQGYNGVHLSAGPVEGLVELIRFFGDEATPLDQQIQDYPFGRDLSGVFNSLTIKEILGNKNIQINNTVTNIFDATEEMNSDDALKFLQTLQQRSQAV